MAARAPPKQPLVAIVGATGTGKSQLAVETAKRYNGEIINADAMQLYHGLPIITNKITQEEREGVPHHLLGSIGLHEPTWTVGWFVEKALRCVEDIHGRGKLPIVVGGTHYYIQALLLRDDTLDAEAVKNGAPQQSDFKTDDELAAAFPILQQDTPSILAELRKVDPVMADRWHPNDRRKIQRSLEIYLRTGKTASATYDEQHAAKAIDDSASALRFPSIVLWLHCDHKVLRTRLDKRVDKMLQAGLLDEVTEMSLFYQSQLAAGTDLDLTRGIWVSIGYKEFQAYREALASGETKETDLVRLRQQAIEATQAATRQYAKRQIRWIRIKLLNALHPHAGNDVAFLLDGSDLSRWDGDVRRPAASLVSAFLAGADMPDATSTSTAAKENLTPKREDMSQRPDLWQRRVCEACDAVFVTESSWETHVKSKGHRYHVKRLQLEAAKNNLSETTRCDAC